MTTSSLDNFKPSLGAATKAISGEPELGVSFYGDAAFTEMRPAFITPYFTNSVLGNAACQPNQKAR